MNSDTVRALLSAVDLGGIVFDELLLDGRIPYDRWDSGDGRKTFPDMVRVFNALKSGKIDWLEGIPEEEDQVWSFSTLLGYLQGQLEVMLSRIDDSLSMDSGFVSLSNQKKVHEAIRSLEAADRRLLSRGRTAAVDVTYEQAPGWDAPTRQEAMYLLKVLQDFPYDSVLTKIIKKETTARWFPDWARIAMVRVAKEWASGVFKDNGYLNAGLWKRIIETVLPHLKNPQVAGSLDFSRTSGTVFRDVHSFEAALRKTLVIVGKVLTGPPQTTWVRETTASTQQTGSTIEERVVLAHLRRTASPSVAEARAKITQVLEKHWGKFEELINTALENGLMDDAGFSKEQQKAFHYGTDLFEGWLDGLEASQFFAKVAKMGELTDDLAQYAEDGDMVDHDEIDALRAFAKDLIWSIR